MLCQHCIALLTAGLAPCCVLQATALIFFKRHYLSQTVLTADPLKTVLVCIYVAAKVRSTPPIRSAPSEREVLMSFDKTLVECRLCDDAHNITCNCWL